MTEVINNMEMHNALGIIYNELIDVVKKHRNIDEVDSKKRKIMADRMHDLAYMIYSEY